MLLLIPGETGCSLGLAAERLRPCICDAPTARRQGTGPQNVGWLAWFGWFWFGFGFCFLGFFFFYSYGKIKSLWSLAAFACGAEGKSQDSLETRIRSCLSALSAIAVHAV